MKFPWICDNFVFPDRPIAKNFFAYEHSPEQVPSIKIAAVGGWGRRVFAISLKEKHDAGEHHLFLSGTIVVTRAFEVAGRN